MHWVIQSNLFNEDGVNRLIETLERGVIPYDLVKIIPFVGEMEHDLDITGNVICIGSYSMRHLAKKKGWVPGVFDLEPFTYDVCIEKWPGHMLNQDAVVVMFYDVMQFLHSDFNDEPVFIRPIADSKAFAGGIMDHAELSEFWQNMHNLLGNEDPSGMTFATRVMMSKPKTILREYRNWVVDGKVVTSSLYKNGNRVLYSDLVDQRIIDYAQARADEWQPLRAFVLDVALLPENQLKIVEINTLNSSGLYAANTNKLVEAIESMKF
jgi:hypothetical protein